MTNLTDDFKQAMRRLATTIAIVTAGKGEECTGMAATAVMSVTADPPTLIVAVNRNASIAPILADEEEFCVNLLAARHQGLVGIFSGQKKGRERFETGDWQFNPDGPPVLGDAVASMMCRKSGAFEVSTHILYTGEVTGIVNHPEIDPLVWVDGTFASAARLKD
ncbi:MULTISPECIES: flavin reductase family protein [Sphingobium]|uniref:Flavin reductase n=1 Tax=Sphingobium baderi TaxID=1332080 RepID=A0A0S3F054_9SPHN|nr:MULTISPECIES: flavin reductase family protein [Sphingobium]ALR21073.1 flavin reductase [Sphingobium baderi]